MIIFLWLVGWLAFIAAMRGGNIPTMLFCGLCLFINTIVLINTYPRKFKV